MDLKELVKKLNSIRDHDVWASMLPVEQLAREAAWQLEKFSELPDLNKENTEIRKKYSDLKGDVSELQSLCNEFENENLDLFKQLDELELKMGDYRMMAESLERANRELNEENLRLKTTLEESRISYLKNILGDFTFSQLHDYIVDLIKKGK